MGDRLRSEGIAAVSLGNGEVEIRRAIPIEQGEEPGGRATEVSAVERELTEEGLGTRATGDEAIAAAMLACFALLASERGKMGFVFDLLPRVPGALMTGHLLLPV